MDEIGDVAVRREPPDTFNNGKKKARGKRLVRITSAL